jgi:hypothetical protein
MERLHVLENGTSAPSLIESHNARKRRKLNELAMEVKDSISRRFPQVNHWDKLTDQDKLFYTLILEEKAAKENINIYKCVDRWPAAYLLSYQFKRMREAANSNEQEVDQVRSLLYFL